MTLDPLFDFTGKIALVTGGSRGLGYQMVKAFAERGADVIVASAGLDTVPLAWIRLLNDGGRLMIPLTADLPGHARISGGVTLMVTRRGDVFDACFVGPVGIYNCHSGRSGEASARLAAALRKPELGALLGSPSQAVSLRIGGAADDSCWLEGDGWWISTRSNP